MNLHIRVRYLASFDSEAVRKLARYRNDDQFVDVDANQFTDEQLDKLYELAKADNGKEGARALCQRIAAYRNVKANPTGTKIGKLESLAAALRAYIEPSPNKWVFYDEKDGHALPYFVASIKYEKGDSRNGVQASVVMRLAAIGRKDRDGRSVTFHVNNLGRTVIEILNDASFYLETPAAVERYLEDIELYKQWATLTGSQFKCIGTAFPTDAYSYGNVAMERDGQPTTVVMDDATDEEADDSRRSSRNRGGGTTTSKEFWSKGRSDEDEETSTESDGEGVVVTPVHPYLKVFDLARHEFVKTHVRNITPYEYDTTAASKLVLPDQTKALIDILVQGSADIMEDIILGKTGGTIVISTGPPGTGKTLTAEVFAEKIRCPLYVVQCSQLGTDEETVEKQLQRILDRASRWRAILLIDEADVYVHTRGTDIQQNAIVGVFLRVLEHYRGVLFMTSNRSTIIDDAIMSRATAWIRYDYPTKEQLTQLWTVLSTQYKMPLDKGLIEALVEKYPRLSGRNIKNMLKLAGLLLRKATDTKPDVKLFGYVSTFLDLKVDDKEPS